MNTTWLNLAYQRLMPLGFCIGVALLALLAIAASTDLVDRVAVKQLCSLAMGCWFCFAMAAAVENLAGQFRRDAGGVLLSIGLRTGGVAMLVLAIAVLVDRDTGRQMMLCLGGFYLVALIVDTGLWLRQIRLRVDVAAKEAV